jgi:hypothetical protein
MNTETLKTLFMQLKYSLMKHCMLSFVLLVLFSTIASGQERDTVFIKMREGAGYHIDTVFFESPMQRRILVGTTILPSTRNQMYARGYGLYLDKVTSSKCSQMVDHEDVGEGNIKSIVDTDSTLTVDISITENCCHSFLCDISTDSTATLNLIYHEYGGYCACNCCFGLTYHLSKANYQVFPKIKAVMINNKRETLKEIKR